MGGGGGGGWQEAVWLAIGTRRWGGGVRRQYGGGGVGWVEGGRGRSWSGLQRGASGEGRPIGLGYFPHWLVGSAH